MTVVTVSNVRARDPELEVNFMADWIAVLEAALHKLGYDVKGAPQEISLAYFNVQRRSIRPTPRRVHIASQFTCPAADQPGLDALKAKIIAGNDLRANQSTRLNRPDYDDDMLNDFGIHHLHLGTTVRDDGFVARTKHVLYAVFDETDAYLIDVRPHGRGVASHRAWADTDLLEIVHSNWPHVTGRSVPHGVSDADEFSSDARYRLRKKGLGMLVQLADGTVLFPPGGSYQATGLSSDVLRKSDDYMMAIEGAQRFAIAKARDFAARSALMGYPLQFPLKLQLVLAPDGQASATVVGQGATWNLGQLLNYRGWR